MSSKCRPECGDYQLEIHARHYIVIIPPGSMIPSTNHNPRLSTCVRVNGGILAKPLHCGEPLYLLKYVSLEDQKLTWQTPEVHLPQHVDRSVSPPRSKFKPESRTGRTVVRLPYGLQTQRYACRDLHLLLGVGTQDRLGGDEDCGDG
jgi:hypothetical protein